MMVPPLSERPVTEEDEEQFRRESAPRRYTLWERWSDYRDDVKRNRPKGAKARFRAWMDADAVDWGIRVAVVFLFIGGSYSLYINGVAYGWWHAWGEKPTVAATTTPAARPAPSASSEPAMSGGYEYLLDTLTYAWNTGDTQLFEDITEPGDNFRETYIQNVDELYSHGWMYDNSSTVTRIVSVEPVTDPKWNAQPNTIGVVLTIVATNGTSCVDKRIIVSDEFNVNAILFMTWKDGRWIATKGEVLHDVRD